MHGGEGGLKWRFQGVLEDLLVGMLPSVCQIYLRNIANRCIANVHNVEA
jgi:hypothetical protein